MGSNYCGRWNRGKTVSILTCSLTCIVCPSLNSFEHNGRDNWDLICWIVLSLIHRILLDINLNHLVRVLYNVPLCCFRVGGIPARNAKGERLLLFMGIIDILQSYRWARMTHRTWSHMTWFSCIFHNLLSLLIIETLMFANRIVKKLEHGWKALVHDGVSCVNLCSQVI